MKNRNNVNIFIDILLFVILGAITGIGWLMKIKLPSGRDLILATGENHDLIFWGMDRHQWGTIHLAAALVMLGLLVLHIVFHWKTILCMLRNAVPSRSLRRIMVGSVVVISAAFFLGAFFITPERGRDKALYRNIRRNLLPEAAALSKPLLSATPDGEAGQEPALVEKPRESRLAETEKMVDRFGRESELLNGQMTLIEAAYACGLSLADVRARLGLPPQYPETETLGRLRRTRGLTMIEIRGLLEKPR